MRQFFAVILLAAAAAGLTSCAYKYERTYEAPAENYSALPCQSAENGGFLGTRLWSHKEAYEICSLKNEPHITANGVRICPQKERCSDEAMLPYEPCAQPMPTYYGDISSETSAEGIMLIHPMTRTLILCYDLPNESAVTCADNFKAAGYVLVTDLPQVTAGYDELKTNTYPTRRWRGHGENVPRW